MCSCQSLAKHLLGAQEFLDRELAALALDLMPMTPRVRPDLVECTERPTPKAASAPELGESCTGTGPGVKSRRGGPLTPEPKRDLGNAQNPKACKSALFFSARRLQLDELEAEESEEDESALMASGGVGCPP